MENSEAWKRLNAIALSWAKGNEATGLPIDLGVVGDILGKTTPVNPSVMGVDEDLGGDALVQGVCSKES